MAENDVPNADGMMLPKAGQAAPSEAQQNKPDSIIEDEKRQQEQANGALLANIGIGQTRLNQLADMLARRGIRIPGLSDAAGRSTAGMKEGEARDVDGEVAKYASEAEAYLLQPAAAEGLLAAVGVTEAKEASESAVFDTLHSSQSLKLPAEMLKALASAGKSGGMGGIG